MALAPLRWMLRRDLKAQGFDPMLPRYADKCWCSACGLYFNSGGGFARHFDPDRQCFTPRQLRERGWCQNETGHWITSAMPARASAARRQAATD